MDPFYWALILLVAGLFVVVLELFIPSAGVLGVLAAVLLISGVVVGFVDSPLTGTTILLAMAFLLPILFTVMVKIWPNTPIGRRIMVKAMTQQEVMPIGTYLDKLKTLVDKVGVAKTKMLPSGMITIDGEHYDAVSDGFAIEPGEPVKVIAIRSNRIYVQPYNPEDDIATNFDQSSMLEKTIDELGIDSIDDSNPR